MVQRFNEVVKEAMACRGMTTYVLAKRLDGRLSRGTLYNFLNGTSEIGSDKLSAIFTELGLKVVENDSVSTNQ